MDRVRDLGGRGLRGGFNQLGDFRKFILRGNVVDLAVGIVIGAAFTALVTSFVNNIITPLIPSPSGNLLTWAFNVPYTGKPLQIGIFISAIISFIIVAAVVYFFVVKPVNALTDRFTPHKNEAPTTRECPFCLSTVPLKATRCAYCTAQLPPADTTTAATGV
jgi:large conductance mechanosensitive channel